MARVKTTGTARWTSATVQTLLGEIAELGARLERERQALQTKPPGSEGYVEHWAQTAVLLEWLQMKIQDLLREMEALEQTWPD